MRNGKTYRDHEEVSVEQREIRVGPEQAGTRCLLEEMQLFHRHQRDPGDALMYVMISPGRWRKSVSAQETGLRQVKQADPVRRCSAVHQGCKVRT